MAKFHPYRGSRLHLALGIAAVIGGMILWRLLSARETFHDLVITALPALALTLGLLIGIGLPLSSHLRRVERRGCTAEWRAEIDGRKQIEEDLREKTADLREKTLQLELFQDISGDAFWQWDPQTDEQLISPRWKAMLGYAAQEDVENLGMWQSLTSVEDGQDRAAGPPSAERSLVDQILREGSPDGGKPYEAVVRYRHKDGSTVWVLTRGRAIRDENGRLLRILGCHTDITPLKRAERNLARHAAELERSNAELEQFAYAASHDLQEPLRMVASYTALLEKRYRGRLDERADRYIHYAVDGAKRMQTLIRDLLALSRVGRERRAPEPVDLCEVVEEALANLRLEIDAAEARIELGEFPSVLGDRAQLVQVMQNLLSNAIKFRRDSASPRIRIEARRIEDGSAGDWRIEVRDNGIGIEPEHSERIFGVFQRLHERDRFPGSGIGLAIARKIVEGHGGRIGVESSPSSGSVFWIAFPAAANEERAA